RCSWVLAVHFFFSSRRRHTRSKRDWSSDVCSSDLAERVGGYHVADQADVPLMFSNLITDAIWQRRSRRYPADQVVNAFDTPAVRSEERRVGKECKSGRGW